MQTMNTSQQPPYELTDADKKRQKRIAAAWDAYHGDLEPPLIPIEGQADDNVMSNRCAPIVDRGVDFLFGKPVGITVEEGAPQEAQDFLEKCWGKNESRLPLLQKLGMSGAVAGQACLRIVPSDDEQTFRLVVIDPSTLFVQTLPQDCESVAIYCIEYSTTETINGRVEQVYYHEEIARVESDQDTMPSDLDPDDTWSISHWTRIGDKGVWQAIDEPIAWPYDFPPLFCCQNLPLPHEYFGIADITDDLIAMNRSIQLMESLIARTGKMYGNPVLYATGVGESLLDIVPGKIIGLPLAESKIVAVTLVTDVGNMLSFVDGLRSDMDEQSSVPAVALGRLKDMPRGNISGVALALEFMPLLQKTEKKRCLYGELIINVCKALLTLAGFSEDIAISLAWQDPIPHDDLVSVQAALAKQQLGVSSATLIEEQGYDPAMEADRVAAEQAQQATNYSRGVGLPPMPQPLPGQPGEPAQQAPNMVAPVGTKA